MATPANNYGKTSLLHIFATNSRQRNAVAHLHSERDKRTYAGLNAASLFTKKKQKEAPRKFRDELKKIVGPNRPA